MGHKDQRREKERVMWVRDGESQEGEAQRVRACTNEPGGFRVRKMAGQGRQVR